MERHLVIFGAWDLTTNFDLTSTTNDLYKLNSIYGGVIIPRGVSLVAMDLRKLRFVQNMFQTQKTQILKDLLFSE